MEIDEDLNIPLNLAMERSFLTLIGTALSRVMGMKAWLEQIHEKMGEVEIEKAINLLFWEILL